MCDYIIPFCDAVVLSVGTLSGVVATSCVCRLLFGRELFLLDWRKLAVGSRNGRRDVFAKRAAAMTINHEAFGFSEGPEV